MPPVALLPLAAVVPPVGVVVLPDTLLPFAVIVLPVAVVVPPVALLPLDVAVPTLAIVVPPVAIVVPPVALLPLRQPWLIVMFLSPPRSISMAPVVGGVTHDPVSKRAVEWNLRGQPPPSLSPVVVASIVVVVVVIVIVVACIDGKPVRWCTRQQDEESCYLVQDSCRGRWHDGLYCAIFAQIFIRV